MNTDTTTGGNDGCHGETNIRPKNDFTSGINIGFSSMVGDSAKSFIESAPEYYKTASFNYSVELNIKNPEDGSKVIQHLEEAKSMIISMIPSAEATLELGVEINFRHVATSVFVEISLSGQLGEMVTAQMGNLNMESVDFEMNASGTITSGLKLDNVFEATLEELIDNATRFKVEGTGDVTKLKKIVAYIGTLTPMLEEFIPKKFRFLISLIKLVGCFRTFQYSLTYDSDELSKQVKELAGTIAHNKLGGEDLPTCNPEMGMQMLSGVVAQGQATGKQMIDGGKGMVLGFLAPFMETLKCINYDNIVITLCSSKTYGGVVTKITLCFVGLTTFLNENVLN